MIPRDIIRKIHRIEITTKRLVNDLFAGQYHSVFKGQGMEFDEVREYNFGDDIRSIDWNVTARTGKTHIKKFSEERELSVMILVDASQSNYFGTSGQLKSALAAEMAGVLALSAIRNNDKVGLVIFTDTIEKYIAPKKGMSHILRVIREILYFKPKNQSTDIASCLDFLNKVTKRKTVSFIISDFYQNDILSLKHSLSIANKKHDLIAISLSDSREKELPNAGIFELEDAETGKRHLIDSSSLKVRENFKNSTNAFYLKRKKLFQSVGIDHIEIQTSERYEQALAKFFRLRKKRKANG